MARYNGNGLTDKQQTFADTYLCDPELNATKSYKQAYPKSSLKSAEARASELLRNIKVSTYIAKAMDARSRRTEIDSDGVLQEKAKMAFANMLDYITPTEDGAVTVDLSKLTRDQAAAITEVTVDEYTDGRGEGAREVRRIRFKLADKGKHLELLGKHLKLFTDRHELTGKDGAPLEVETISDRQLARLIAFTLDGATRDTDPPRHSDD